MQKDYISPYLLDGGSPDTPGNPDIPDMPDVEIPQVNEPKIPGQDPARA
jgi:hypothetical protein